MTKYFAVLDHYIFSLFWVSCPGTGQVKVLVLENSFLLLMVTEDWNMEEVLEEEGDILFFSLSVTSSVEKAGMTSQN